MKLLSLLALLLLTACGGADNKNQAEVTRLGIEVKRLSAEVIDLTSRLGDLRMEHIRLKYKGPQGHAEFDPQENKIYRTVTGPAGPLLVVLDKLEPYLDGYTVSMRIGNPTAAGYVGVKGKVQWGKTFDMNKGDEYNKLAEKDLELLTVLPAGSWTSVKFNIAPAKPDEVRRIIFAPVLNELQLRGANS